MRSEFTDSEKYSVNNFTEEDYLILARNYRDELLDIVKTLDDIAEKELDLNKREEYNAILIAKNKKDLIKRSALLNSLQELIDVTKLIKSREDIFNNLPE